jgi:hypothetical protein
MQVGPFFMVVRPFEKHPVVCASAISSAAGSRMIRLVSDDDPVSEPPPAVE